MYNKRRQDLENLFELVAYSLVLSVWLELCHFMLEII
jgi:hypothetical protein